MFAERFQKMHPIMQGCGMSVRLTENKCLVSVLVPLRHRLHFRL